MTTGQKIPRKKKEKRLVLFRYSKKSWVELIWSVSSERFISVLMGSRSQPYVFTERMWASQRGFVQHHRFIIPSEGPQRLKERLIRGHWWNRRVVSAQINSFSTSALLLLLLLITILSGVMYLTVWQPQRRSIAGSVDLQRPGGLNLFQSRLNYSLHFRLLCVESRDACVERRTKAPKFSTRCQSINFLQ